MQQFCTRGCDKTRNFCTYLYVHEFVFSPIPHHTTPHHARHAVHYTPPTAGTPEQERR